jgi:hypothetical protein
MTSAAMCDSVSSNSVSRGRSASLPQPKIGGDFIGTFDQGCASPVFQNRADCSAKALPRRQFGRKAEHPSGAIFIVTDDVEQGAHVGTTPGQEMTP